jgi:plastocyanin
MKALLALALLSTALLAGCTGSSAPVTPPRDDQGRHVIEMTASNKFVPAKAEVPAGATVVWVHAGGAPHDVQGTGFSSGPAGGMRAGDEYAHTFAEPGSYDYYCHVHLGSGMKGTLTVVAAS